MRLLGEEDTSSATMPEAKPEASLALTNSSLEAKMAALRSAQADTDHHMANAKKKVAKPRNAQITACVTELPHHVAGERCSEDACEGRSSLIPQIEPAV